MVALYGNVIFTLSSNASHENPLIEEAFLDNGIFSVFNEEIIEIVKS